MLGGILIREQLDNGGLGWFTLECQVDWKKKGARKEQWRRWGYEKGRKLGNGGKEDGRTMQRQSHDQPVEKEWILLELPQEFIPSEICNQGSTSPSLMLISMSQENRGEFLSYKRRNHITGRRPKQMCWNWWAVKKIFGEKKKKKFLLGPIMNAMNSIPLRLLTVVWLF